MICQLCGKRKGKRLCPTIGGPICPECCGTKRRKTVSCPDSCPYLKKSQRYLGERRLTKSEIKIRNAFPAFFQNLERRIISIRRNRLTELQDTEVKEALEQNLSNLNLKNKGIIYEYKSVNPRVQILSDAISEFLSSCQKLSEESRELTDCGSGTKSLSSEGERKYYDLETLIFLLKEEILFLKRMIEEGKGNTYYLDLINTLH